MPLYTVMTEAKLLDQAKRSDLVRKLTTLHSEAAGVPPSWIHVVFQDYAPGHGFTAGVPAPVLALTLVIRTGRSSDYKRDLLQRIWAIVQVTTRLPDDQIVLDIQEVPPSQAMEMGRTMPDVADVSAAP
ncbi:tautomerase family protein [Neoroseomonas lacus]|nr:tautomerase family protein [Neoroseomonas lacus]